VDEVDAPVLVDDRPDADGGVVSVPVDDALEQALLAFARALGRQTPIGEFRPDHQPHAVGDVVIARVGDLDVKAKTVQPQVPRLSELIFDEDRRWRRADRVGVIVLVQSTAQVEPFAVQEESTLACLEGPKPEVLGALIDVPRIFRQRGPDRVEVRVIRCPEEDCVEGNPNRNGIGLARNFTPGPHHRPPIGSDDLDIEGEVPRQCCTESDLGLDHSGQRRRADVDTLDMVGVSPFEPDRLPYAR